MRVLKRFLQMFFASFALFLLLSSLDEYEVLVAPFIKKTVVQNNILVTPGMNKAVEGLILGFNTTLSQIYISSDPSGVRALPTSEQVKKAIAEDIEFLIRSGKIMDMKVKDIHVEKVERVSPLVVKVWTREVVSLSYLNIIDKATIMPKRIAEYGVVYNLELMSGGLTIVGFEVTGVKELES